MELWELTFLFSQWTHHLPFLLFQVEWQHFSLCSSLHPGESNAIWKVIIKKQTWNKWTTMKKRDIPNMMYMAVMPILIYQKWLYKNVTCNWDSTNSSWSWSCPSRAEPVWLSLFLGTKSPNPMVDSVMKQK